MSDTNRRIDNGTFVPNKSVGTLVSTNATIGNLVVTGTLIETCLLYTSDAADE